MLSLRAAFLLCSESVQKTYSRRTVHQQFDEKTETRRASREPPRTQNRARLCRCGFCVCKASAQVSVQTLSDELRFPPQKHIKSNVGLQKIVVVVRYFSCFFF